MTSLKRAVESAHCFWNKNSVPWYPVAMTKLKKNLGQSEAKTNVPVLLFATFLVVVGILSVALLSSRKMEPEVKPEQPASSAAATTSTTTIWTSGTILMVNADSVMVVDPSGRSERLARANFWSQAKSTKLPAEGSAAANSSNVYLLAPEQTSGTRETFLSPDRRYVARLGTPKADNAATLEIIQGHESPQIIVLRDRRGQALSDAALLGWLGPRTLAVMAVATSTRGLFAADLNGTLKQIAQLPDNIVYAEVRAGAVWYATAQLGEGLESAPQAPSELHRLTPDGQDTLAARDELQVFQVAVPDDKGHVMYTTDDGQSFYLAVGQNGTRKVLGKRRPLGYLPDGKLLLRDNLDLMVFDPESGASNQVTSLPEGEVRVFVIP